MAQRHGGLCGRSKFTVCKQVFMPHFCLPGSMLQSSVLVCHLIRFPPPAHVNLTSILEL